MKEEEGKNGKEGKEGKYREEKVSQKATSDFMAIVMSSSDLSERDAVRRIERTFRKISTET